jgi:hypothetical protein
MKIYTSSITLPGIEKIEENPLPALRDNDPHKCFAETGTLTKEDKDGLGRDIGRRVLPYLVQDRYGRDKKAVNYKTVVIENGLLRAEFLCGFGGRLRSLYDLKKKRELLFANPVVQPGNLAIRNAWLSGGIEWNIGQLGHTFTTCSPVYFARVKTRDGDEFLRLYEYERQKRVFWQIDFRLPEGSPFLQAHVRIVNDRDSDTPMYWWTNIAVTETEKTRVFSSSEEVLYNDSKALKEWIDSKPGADELRKGKIFYGRGRMPYIESKKGRAFEFDGSLPRNFPHSQDFFFQNPPKIKSPWEAASEPDGFMFFMRNTQPLRCNKMFCWGSGRGGRFWQDFLSLPGKGDYLELQAGIAPTQIHGYTMKAGSEIHFTQFFGSMQAPKAGVLYRPWDEARPYAESLMNKTLPGEPVLEADKRFKAASVKAPVSMELLHCGSGWGALESLRRKKSGEKPVPQGFIFPESSIGSEELPWLTLLETGGLPPLPENGLPVSYMTDLSWKKLIRQAAGQNDGKPTGALNFLAVLLWEELKCGEAVDIWEKLAKEGDLLALRNLASARQIEGDAKAALGLMKKAFAREKGGTDQAFAEEYFRLLLSFGKYDELWTAYKALPEKTASKERLRLLAGQAAVEVGEYAFIGDLFSRELAVIQEGETTLTDIWFKAEAQKLAVKRGAPYSDELLREVKKTLTPPKHIDFRMNTAEK